MTAAAELLEPGVAVSQAVHVLATRFDCSPQQARRYVQRTARGGPAATDDNHIGRARLNPQPET